VSIADTVTEAPPTFKEWLAAFDTGDDAVHEFYELIGLLAPAPSDYAFKEYVKLIPDKKLDLFLRAEAAWKTEMAAHSATRKSLGLETVTPEQHLARTVFNCLYRDRTGEMCGREVVPGVDRCVKHGGALVDPEVRRNILLSAYATIVEGSQKAVDALLDVVENGRSEMARVQAAKELLDRAGLTADTTINVRISAEIDAGSILRERLESMATKIEIIETHESSDQKALSVGS
jgi:hypothetical protein